MRDYCLHQWKRFPKPHIFGEFGIRSHSTTADKDPDGRALHNAFWAGLCSGANGTVMPWWHGNYIDPLDLYFHFTAIRNFTQGLPFGTERWRQIHIGKPEYAVPPDPVPVRDVVLTPAGGFRRRKVNAFRIGADGTINDPTELLELLHGDGHGDLRNPPVFEVEYPEPGRFTVHVGRVSNSGLLRIRVDGELRLEKAFPCGEGLGKSATYRPRWKLWESVYDDPVSIDIPAGRHTIEVENTGTDWIRVKSYSFGGCLQVRNPNLLCAAIGTERIAICWFQNRDSSWYNHHQRKDVPRVPASTVTLQGFPRGRYTVEWWETWKGRPTRTETLETNGPTLELQLPPIATDLAAKIRRTARPAGPF